MTKFFFTNDDRQVGHYFEINSQKSHYTSQHFTKLNSEKTIDVIYGKISDFLYKQPIYGVQISIFFRNCYIAVNYRSKKCFLGMH